MKIKLEFMLPDVKTAKSASKQMLLSHIQYQNVHFLANPETNLGSLQVATSIEKSNIMHEGERGLLIGAGLGLLAGAYVLMVPRWVTYSPLWFTNSKWYVILIITSLFGAVAVAIGAALLGVNVFNTDLNKYKTRIQQGGVLMIVSVPFYRAKEIKNVMRQVC